MNRIDKIALPGGAQFSFREQLAKARKKASVQEESIVKSEFSANAVSEALLAYSDLIQNWANAVNLLDEQLEKYGVNEEAVDEIVTRFCLGRMEEAKWLIEEEGDSLRFSFWLYSEDAGGLKLLFSDEIHDEKTLRHVFKPGAGLCGQCYVENRYFSFADAPKSIYYEKIRDEEPQYHGLLLYPVKPRSDENSIGVLSIDRMQKEEFSKDAANVASALSDLIAYAMKVSVTYPLEDSA